MSVLELLEDLGWKPNDVVAVDKIKPPDPLVDAVEEFLLICTDSLEEIHLKVILVPELKNRMKNLTCQLVSMDF